jgi:hypothetical protein
MTWNERGPIVNLKIRSEILIQVLTIESGTVLEEYFSCTYVPLVC